MCNIASRIVADEHLGAGTRCTSCAATSSRRAPPGSSGDAQDGGRAPRGSSASGTLELVWGPYCARDDGRAPWGSSASVERADEPRGARPGAENALDVLERGEYSHRRYQIQRRTAPRTCPRAQSASAMAGPVFASSRAEALSTGAWRVRTVVPARCLQSRAREELTSTTLRRSPPYASSTCPWLTSRPRNCRGQTRASLAGRS